MQFTPLLSALLLVFSCSFTNTMAALIGDYKLQQVILQDGKSIDLPREFHVKIGDRDVAQHMYSLSTQIGNSIGGTLNVDLSAISDSHEYKATISNLFGTKMMPPPEVYAVERGLNSIWSSTTSIKLHGDELTFQGVEGMVVCGRVSS